MQPLVSRYPRLTLLSTFSLAEWWQKSKERVSTKNVFYRKVRCGVDLLLAIGVTRSAWDRERPAPLSGQCEDRTETVSNQEATADQGRDTE